MCSLGHFPSSVPGEGIQFLPQPRVFTGGTRAPTAALPQSPCSTCCWKAAGLPAGPVSAFREGQRREGGTEGKGGRTERQYTQVAGRNRARLLLRLRNALVSAQLSCKETWARLLRPSHHPSPKGHLRVLEWGHLCTFCVSIHGLGCLTNPLGTRESNLQVSPYLPFLFSH